MATNKKQRRSTTLPKVPGRYGFGHGLYLLVRGPEAASWFYRFTTKVDGRAARRELGLGPAHGPLAVSLDDARIATIEAAKLVKAGRDPLAEKEAKRQMERAAEKQAAPETVSFLESAESFIEQHQKGEQWEQSIRDHAKPLHKMAVGSIKTEHVLAVLRPIWLTKNETASRLRSRIEAILDASKVLGQREGENPARWQGHLALILPARSKVRAVVHHAALDWREIPAFMADLAEIEGTAAKALALTVLCATRTAETIGAKWSEIQGDVWVIPPERTKTRKQHRVPLSTQAMAIIDSMKPLRDASDLVFPSGMTDSEGKAFPLSNMAMLMTMRRLKGQKAATVHGTARSGFRDFCADTGVARELAEACLAHAVGGTEAAYFRSDVLDLRRGLMQKWADHCLPAGGLGANVVSLGDRLAGSGSSRA